jgi:hypothetical protein
MSKRRFTFDATPLPPSNVLRVGVDMAVDLQQLATWPADASRAFMLGVAQVLAAQKEAAHV